MKKIIFILIIALVIIGGVIVWITNSNEPISLSNSVQIGIILVLVIFAIGIAYSKIGSLKKGLPSEDEFSKKFLKFAAARAYYFSLYLWLGILYLNSSGNYDPENLFGAGILGMALLFGIHWLILKYTGIKDE